MRNIRYCIDNFQYVSFDVFDTLIKRSVAKPTDIFVLIERYCQAKKINIPAGFAKLRKESERLVKEKFGARTDLGMIYDELRKYCGKYTELLMSLEIQFELDGCWKNEYYTEILTECIEKEKVIILISDMYLPSEIIKKMLAKCGIIGYKRLYVSCESNATKHSGDLFQIVLNDFHIHSGELIHFGDNFKSDFLKPLFMGIRSVWVKNDSKELCTVPHGVLNGSEWTYRTVKANLKSCSYGMTKYQKMGCEILGPLLFGFTQWLIENISNEEIRDIYFMSRDGYILKQAFDVLEIEGIHTHYLYSSRRSYQVPMIWKHSEFKDIIQPFLYVRKMTLKEFLLRIGLEPEKYSSKVLDYDLDMDYVYEKGGLFNSEEIINFYNSIRDDVIANSREEYDALSSYIQSLNMPEKIAVIDVGYRGTMQYALEELLKERGWNVEVKGYYVGISNEAFYVRNGKISAEGYLYFLDDGKLYQEIKGMGPALYEIPFLAPHGSVRKFSLIEGERCKPEFEMFEYENNEKRLVDELHIIEEYQKGAIGFVKHMAKVFPINSLCITPDVALYGFGRLVTRPTLREAELWGDFRFINYVYMYIARPESINFYIRHPGKLKRDFLNCSWKIGFMRRLFRIPLPYKSICDLLKTIYYKL